MLFMSVRGPFNSRIVEYGRRKLLIVGYEGFYAREDNESILLASYDITDDKLNPKSIIYSPQGGASTNGIASQDISRPYIAVSTYNATNPIPGIPPAFLPQTFSIELYKYNEEGNIQHVTTFDMADLVPDIYRSTVAYNGIAGLSSDSKYIIITWATSDLKEQWLGFLSVSDDLQSLTLEAKVKCAPTNKDNTIGFPQGANMWKRDKHTYAIVSQENSWSLALPRGNTAQVVYYEYNVKRKTVEMKSQAWVPQYIEGYDVDICNERIYVALNKAEIDSSIEIIPRPPFDNPAPEKESNLRVYQLCKDKLVYVGGEELHADALQVKVSNDGSTLALVTSPTYFNYTFIPPDGVSALSSAGRWFTPSTLQLFDVNRHGRLSLFGQSVASPLSFGVAFNKDILAINGVPTYSNTLDITSGQKDSQLYRI